MSTSIAGKYGDRGVRSAAIAFGVRSVRADLGVPHGKRGGHGPEGVAG